MIEVEKVSRADAIAVWVDWEKAKGKRIKAKGERNTTA